MVCYTSHGFLWLAKLFTSLLVHSSNNRIQHSARIQSAICARFKGSRDIGWPIIVVHGHRMKWNLWKMTCSCKTCVRGGCKILALCSKFEARRKHCVGCATSPLSRTNSWPSSSSSAWGNESCGTRRRNFRASWFRRAQLKSKRARQAARFSQITVNSWLSAGRKVK